MLYRLCGLFMIYAGNQQRRMAFLVLRAITRTDHSIALYLATAILALAARSSAVFSSLSQKKLVALSAQPMVERLL